MYCQNCLNQILQKLNNHDIIVLEYMINENSTMPQCSLSIQTIIQNFDDNNDITPHNIYTSLKRLNIFGFVETQKWTRKNKYYVTIDGIQILKLIEQNISD